MKTFNWSALWKKYKFVGLILLVGLILMMIPSRNKQSSVAEKQSTQKENFSLEEAESKMEAILSQIDGVGQLRIMLTLKNGSQLELAQNAEQTQRTGDSAESRTQQETVTVNRGSGYQDIVVTGETYPTYQGALVVCQGADDSEVRLAITQAITSLTGLGADKISIVKWKQ